MTERSTQPVEVLDDGRVRVSNGVITSVHSARLCADRVYGCWMHDPRGHALDQAPVHWRDDRGIAERICDHGIGHPDPQDAAYNFHELGRDITGHGCDGCCRPFPKWARRDN